MDSPGAPTDNRPNDESVAMTVVDAVAEAEGVDATALTPPLGEVIDTDALEKLVRESDTETAVEFEYRGWLIEVQASGDVSLRES